MATPCLRAWLIALLTLGGCGSAAEAPAPSAPAATAPAAAPATGTATAPAAGAADPSTPAPAPAPPAAPVDLLRSVRADVAVSSVYRDQTGQLPRLTDGNLETAWNSRTGELAGAWIEARLPATATVTGIEMTVGFTHVQGDSDLFTGNHRVSKVRVLRDGTEVRQHALDPESRALQAIPVEGAGGVWRVEVVETVAGTRSSWREVCISEIRILGRDPAARDGERIPRFAVGALPPPRAEPGSHDRALVAQRFADDLRWFESAWGRFERQVRQRDRSSGEPDITPEERASMVRTHRTILERVAELAELVDESRADRLRVKASRDVEWNRTEQRQEALREGIENVAAAFDAVAVWLGDAEPRCAWARAHVGLRFARVAHDAEYRSWLADMDEFYAEDTRTAADRRTTRDTDRASAAIQRMAGPWRRDPAATAAQIRAYEPPAGTPLQADWDAIRANVEAVRTVCGWQ